jgi:uncharacterized protein YrrD
VATNRNLNMGMDIISKDGHKIGVVDGLVMDPHTGEVRSIVLRKGLFFPADLIVPMDAVLETSDKQVKVDVTKDEASQMPEYMDSSFVVPPSGYYPAMGVYYWPATTVWAGQYEHDLTVEGHEKERDPDAIVVNEGTLVLDSAGEDVGRITELATDERGRVVGFKVEEGFFRHHDRYIPAHFIKSADNNTVTLSTEKAKLEELHAGKDKAKQ